MTDPSASGGSAGGGPEATQGEGLFELALGALGIVFGDIGTSPLYAVQTVFSIATTR
jgi:KUP system potassium uptake protein